MRARDLVDARYRWLTFGPPGQPEVSLLLSAIPGPPVLDAATSDQIRSLIAKGWSGTSS